MNEHMSFDKSWALRMFERELYGQLAQHPSLPKLEWSIWAEVDLEYYGPLSGYRTETPEVLIITFGLEPGSLAAGFEQQGQVYWWPEADNAHSVEFTLFDGWEDRPDMEPMEWESLTDQFMAMFRQIESTWDQDSQEALFDYLMARTYEVFLADEKFGGLLASIESSLFKSPEDLRPMTYLALRTVRGPRNSSWREAASILLSNTPFRSLEEIQDIVGSFGLDTWKSDTHEQQALNLLRSGFEGDLAALKATVNGMMADPYRSRQED